ncbi:MAG: hypothetical protein M1820_009214 [Bogoriella megaspora]|nr:MAG: hypothetical protein M1820_009214 [Bogoriella megaspora]
MISSFAASILSLVLCFLLADPALCSKREPRAVVPHVFVARDTTTGPGDPSATATIASSISTLIPTGKPQGSTAPLKINESKVNEPLQIDDLDEVSLNLDCKNCSLFGDLTFGVDSFDPDWNNPLHPLKGGTLAMKAKGLGGRFELEIFSAVLEKSFDLPFFSQTVLGFGIADTVNVGVLVKFRMIFTVNVEEAMDITFGMDFRVPDDSYINIDVMDPGQSSQHGFNSGTGLEINATPFSANLSIPKVTISFALEPSIVFGFSAVDDLVHADAGALIDIPKLTVEVEGVSNVDANCRAMNTTNHGPAVSPDLGDAVNVLPKAEIDLSLIREAGIPFVNDNVEHTLASAIFPLSTACLLWDKDNGKLAEATQVIAASSSASSASAASAASASASNDPGKTGAGARNGNPEVCVWSMMLGLGLTCLFGTILL